MNKVMLMGNLARDPEIHMTQSGKSVCQFTVACQRRIPNAQGVRQADFISCIAWDRVADMVHKYFSKGTKILVEGRIQCRSYEAQDSSKRYVTEVAVDTIEFVGRKHDEGHQEEQPVPANSYGQQDDELPY